MPGVPTPCRLCRYSLFLNIWLFDSLVTKQFGSHKCGGCCPSGLMDTKERLGGSLAEEASRTPSRLSFCTEWNSQKCQRTCIL